MEGIRSKTPASTSLASQRKSLTSKLNGLIDDYATRENKPPGVTDIYLGVLSKEWEKDCRDFIESSPFAGTFKQKLLCTIADFMGEDTEKILKTFGDIMDTRAHVLQGEGGDKKDVDTVDLIEHATLTSRRKDDKTTGAAFVDLTDDDKVDIPYKRKMNGPLLGAQPAKLAKVSIIPRNVAEKNPNEKPLPDTRSGDLGKQHTSSAAPRVTETTTDSGIGKVPSADNGIRVPFLGKSNIDLLNKLHVYTLKVASAPRTTETIYTTHDPVAFARRELSLTSGVNYRHFYDICQVILASGKVPANYHTWSVAEGQMYIKLVFATSSEKFREKLFQHRVNKDSAWDCFLWLLAAIAEGVGKV